MTIIVSTVPPPMPPSSSEKRHREQALLGIRAPHLGREALGVTAVALARLEVAAVGEQPLDAVLEEALLLAQIEVHGRSLARLRAENRLRNDVLLDLVRPAVDRDLAPVEVGRRDRGGPVRSDRRLVVAVLVAFVLRRVGQRERADHSIRSSVVACWISEPLILRIDEAGSACPSRACARRRRRAAASSPAPSVRSPAPPALGEARVLEDRRVADPLQGGEFAQAAQALLRHADPGDVGALVAEQELA